MNSQNQKIITQFEGDHVAANAEVEWLEELWRRVDMLGQLPQAVLFNLALKYRSKDKAPMPDFSAPVEEVQKVDGRSKQARALREVANG
jgi:hypothetical protein